MEDSPDKKGMQAGCGPKVVARPRHIVLSNDADRTEFILLCINLGIFCTF